jgi:PAS domain S-box-containing protein
MDRIPDPVKEERRNPMGAHPSADRFESGILDQLPDGLVVTDETDVIRRANPRAGEITGWEVDELVGMPVGRLISMDELAGIARAREAADHGLLERYHCLLRTKSGERREISVAVNRVSDLGTPATIFLMRDIRRQRELERRLLAQLTEKQEVEAFGRTASLVMHDLRNWNNILSLTVRNLQHHLTDPAFCKEALWTLEAVTLQMKTLLNREKLVTPPARANLRCQATTLGDLVHRALNLLTRAGWEAAVAATAVAGLEKPLPCEAAVAEMQQVLFNLLVNAYEAMEEGQRVTVTGFDDPSGKAVGLIIEDTGPGIPPPYLERSLFRPFRSTKPGGLGLGLYHAKTLVEAHGGTIEVMNRQEGTGTRVTLMLPRLQEGAADLSAGVKKEANAPLESTDRRG